MIILHSGQTLRGFKQQGLFLLTSLCVGCYSSNLGYDDAFDWSPNSISGDQDQVFSMCCHHVGPAAT